MASVSFTYNGDYDPSNTAVLSQNALNYYSGPSGNHTLGPFYYDRYIMNDQGVYGIYGTYFIDSQRFDGDPVDQSNKILTGSEYSISLDLSDNTGFLYLGGSNFGDILRAGSGADTLTGGSGNDFLEGGMGADILDGGTGINTASYEHSPAGVTINLTTGDNTGGDAQGDSLTQIQKLLGSAFADSLTGDNFANTLTGNGGGDALYGMGGNDRLVITDTPTFIDGGADKDFLFVTGGGTVSLTESAFAGVEAVYVRNDTHLDMSAVETGSKIISQSSSGHHVEIIGTSGADRIQAGKGGDTIEGGVGGDKLFAGAGADAFHFEAGFGRDNVYRFDVATDHITVDIAGVDAADIVLTLFHGGQDTIVTFAGVEGTNKIILHDVNVAELLAGPSDLFTFGA